MAIRPLSASEWTTVVDLIRDHAPWRPFPACLADGEFMAFWLNTFAALEAQRTLSKEALLATWQSTAEYQHEWPAWEARQHPPAPAPGAGGSSERPDTRLPLRVDRTKRWFDTDLGLFDWREISAFSLLAHYIAGDNVAVSNWMARASAAGCTVIRVLATLGGDYWEGRAQRYTGRSLRCGDQPGFFGALVPFTRLAASHGLKVRWVIFGDLGPVIGEELRGELDARRDVARGNQRVQDRCRAFVDRFVRELAGEPSVVYEIANEYRNIGFGVDSEALLFRLAALVRELHPGAMVNVSAIDGVEWHLPTFTQAPATYASAHISRDFGVFGFEWLKRSGEAAVIDASWYQRETHKAQLQDMPFDSGEPYNAGDARKDGRNNDVSPSTALAFAAGAHSRARLHMACFHHDDGLWCTGWGSATQACLEAWHAGLSAIPQYQGQGPWRGHWAEAPFEHSRFPDTDDVRTVEAFVREGRGAFRAVGVGNHGVIFPVARGRDPESWVKPGRRIRITAGREYDGIGAYAFEVTA